MRFLFSALCSLLYAITATAQTSGQNVIQKKSASAGFTYESFTLGNSQLIGRTSGGTLSGLTLGTGLSLSGTTLSSTGSGGTWGSITGTLSNQTDLQTALDAKLATATAATTYQPLATILTTLSNVSNSSGVLTNNGSGTLSYTATTTGGNGTADSGKIFRATSQGGLVLGGNSGTTGTILGVINGHAGSYAIDAIANQSLGTAIHVGLQAATTTGISCHFTSTAQTFIDLDGTVVGSDCRGLYAYMSGPVVVAADATFQEKVSVWAGKIRFTESDYTSASCIDLVAATPTGTRTITLPNVTGTIITTGDTGTVTNTMLAGSISLTTKVTGTLPVANGGTGITALGTGVATALGVNIGTAGAFVVNGGALGTPSSGTLTNCTGLPVSGITSSTSAALGLGTIELGHATDTTLARSSAGVVTIEGATIATLSTANVFTQTQSIPGITGTGGGGLYLLINGNSTSGSMVGVSGYMPGFTTGSAGGIGFSSGAPSSGYDTFFTRDSAAVMQLGSDGASPTSYQLKSADGTGTNIASSNLTLGGSRSTGTGVGGDVIVITSMSGSSGTSANTTQERSRIIGRFVNLTESTATNFASIALASGKVVGGTATITVWASDGTDHQSLTSEIRFAAINKAGTITATVSQTDGTTAASAGTLTVTYDATQSGSAVLLRANATSSLTQTILRSRCVITALNGDDTQTVTPQ